MSSVKIFAEGTEIIKKEDIKAVFKTIIIPHSVKCIEDYAFKGISCSVYYVGTTEEFGRIAINEDICVPCVECVDGLRILHI